MEGLSLSLPIKIRRGSGSLQLIIAGSGSRPSSLILGGTSGVLGAGDFRLKSPGLEGTSIFGANWCSLLAKDSRRFSGPRGGSIGINTKPTS